MAFSSEALIDQIIKEEGRRLFSDCRSARSKASAYLEQKITFSILDSEAKARLLIRVSKEIEPGCSKE